MKSCKIIDRYSSTDSIYLRISFMILQRNPKQYTKILNRSSPSQARLLVRFLHSHFIYDHELRTIIPKSGMKL